MTSSLRYNWRIVGHLPLLRQLESDVADNRLPNAYIFSGPPEIGKRTVMMTLAHILQCERDYCHDCITCTQIEKGIHSETIEFRDDGETLGVDPIRDLLARLSLTPSSRYKLVLIERAERMTVEAANCLLKILEEPPPQTLFMMTTDTIREILPTVISRSRVLQFQPCRKEELVEWLAAKYLAEDERKLDFAGEISLGRPGVAYKLMEDPAMMDFYKSLYADLTRFLQFNNIFERFAYLQNIVEDRQKINIFLDIFLNILRHKLLTEPAQRARCLAIIERVYEVKRTLRVPVNQRLLLEHLMLSF
jgi:DNA polymerase-3 subunit delta'